MRRVLSCLAILIVASSTCLAQSANRVTILYDAFGKAGAAPDGLGQRECPRIGCLQNHTLYVVHRSVVRT